MTITYNREAATRDATLILDEFENVSVDDLVQPYRDWIDSIHHRVGEFGYLEQVLDVFDSPANPEINARARQLSAKFDRAADIIVAYTLASFASPAAAAAAATAARAVFEAITDSPSLRQAMLSDREMMGGAEDEVAA